jgi:predicted acylesterase/phospholipase RssA
MPACIAGAFPPSTCTHPPTACCRLPPPLPAAAPNVLVWSAVACSSAFPFLYAPQQLLARDSRGAVVPFSAQAAGELQRRWRDGSLEEDLPMRGLR